MQCLCISHFINTCYTRLEDLNQNPRTLLMGGTEWESARAFVQECIQAASRFSNQNPELSNLERAQLLDILFWATELAQRFQPSPSAHSPLKHHSQ
jgi:hypothetical protein